LIDAAAVQALAGAAEVAATTLTIPHPYADGVAEAWIEQHARASDARALAVFAVIRSDHVLVGAMSLRLESIHHRAELGYWIGVPFWRRGYATEAARAIVGFGFDDLGVNRIYATHFTRNPASGRVMQKIGMTFEGCLRQHVRKNGRFEDLARYAILADDEPARLLRHNAIADTS
jgi:RimJ/RimL family protein N-acetyltransferase